MSFLLAPFFALFSRDFYKRMTRAGLGAGFAYLFYGVTLMTVIASAALMVRILPEMDRFTVWLQGQMPVLMWKPQEGLSMRDQSTFTLVHPQYGPLAQFDMTKEEVRLEDLGENTLFVTSKRIYVRQPGRSSLRIYDLTQVRSQTTKGPAAPFEIRPDTIDGLYRQMKPWLITAFIGILWGALLVWKLLAALFYSWVALLINLFRREKLDYSHLLTLAFFVLTPAACVQLLQLIIPRLAALPFGFPGSLALTTCYLYLAVKGTEPPQTKPPAATAFPS